MNITCMNGIRHAVEKKNCARACASSANPFDVDTIIYVPFSLPQQPKLLNNYQLTMTEVLSNMVDIPTYTSLDSNRYQDVDMLLDRRGPSTAEEFVGGQTVSIQGGCFQLLLLQLLRETPSNLYDAYEFCVRFPTLRVGMLGQRLFENSGKDIGHRSWRLRL